MQSRDPFSGDCDGESLEAGPPRESHTLAEPRPVLRGLRLVMETPLEHAIDLLLAEPRPVFRGLRRRGLLPDPDRPAPGACRAETRSQGIATRATPGGKPLQESRLAEPRPVLRGLRLVELVHDAVHLVVVLQSRDSFSGDCDPALLVWYHGNPRPLAEPRPVLRGLRQGFSGRERIVSIFSCRAETRSQGIATFDPHRGAQQNPEMAACRAETRSQGIATTITQS